MRFSPYIVTACLGCMLVAASAAEDAPALPPARIKVAKAEVRELAPTIEVSGTVVSLNDSRIATEVEGVLTWLADVGDAVDAGNVIAQIDSRIMEVELTRARANEARLEAELVFRERQLQRAQELAASNNASANLLDESLANRDQALHELADARAQRERAQGDLDRTRIRAAFSGHVIERLASVGEYIAVGEDVLRLVDTHRKEVALPAPIRITSFVQPGQQVSARLGNDERRLPVRTVVPVGDAVSRMVEIRLSATESDWLVGSPIQVSLPNDNPVTAVAVPRDALVERSGSTFVYRVSDAGTAEQIEARIRSTVGLWVAIDGGIDKGDLIVVRGAERLAPGQSVEIIPDENSQQIGLRD